MKTRFITPKYKALHRTPYGGNPKFSAVLGTPSGGHLTVDIMESGYQEKNEVNLISWYSDNHYLMP